MRTRAMATAMLALSIAPSRLLGAEPPPMAPGGQLPVTMDDTVALALQRNRDVIAARFDISAAELERVAASLYPNPILGYSLGNLVLGGANGQDRTPPVTTSVFGQTVHTVSIADVIDIWDKRHSRMRTAERGLVQHRLLVEDALREIVFEVRSAWSDVVAERADVDLVRENRSRYDETIRISRARRDAGDISEAELRKIELEGLRYQNAVIDEEMQLDIARQRVLALLALDPATELIPVVEAPPPRMPLPLASLLEQALRDRPDLRAVSAGHARAEAAQKQARTEALPDITLGVAFNHSEFVVSGDNPNSLALSLSLPLPLFDRNQANIGRADLDVKRTDNDGVRLAVQIRNEVVVAVRKTERAAALLDVFEKGMLDRATTARDVAERSYKSGAISLLELLEAQRTYIETREQYLRALRDHRQALIDVRHAVAGESVR